MGLVSKLALAQVPVTRIGQGSKVVLELKLTDEARALLAYRIECLPYWRQSSPTRRARYVVVDPHTSRQPLGAAREAQ
jgi:hypothetical protein